MTPKEQSVPKSSGGPWLKRRTGLRIMGLLSVALVALVWYTAPAHANRGEVLRLALVVLGSVWLIFAFTYTLSRWLRRG